MMRKAISEMTGLMPFDVWRLILAGIFCLSLVPGLRSALPVTGAHEPVRTEASLGSTVADQAKAVIRQVLLSVSQALDVAHGAAVASVNAVFNSLHALVSALVPEKPEGGQNV